MSEYLTTLVCLRDHRRLADLTSRNIEAITSAANVRDPRNPVITVERLRQLENLPRHEPTYAEARTLARLLLLPGIAPLLSIGGIHAMTSVFGEPDPFDFGHFTTSDNVPLSIACRLAVSLGLDDPIELDILPIHTQLWATISQNERAAGPGECPWCRGSGGQHLPTCLPEAIWSPRNSSPYGTAAFPRPARPRTRGDSHMAFGLKVLRAAKCVTQSQLASDVKINANYLSRIERLESKLTQGNAEKIAARLGVPVERIFEKPGANGEVLAV